MSHNDKVNLLYNVNTKFSGVTGIFILAIGNITQTLEASSYINNLDNINIFLKFYGKNKRIKNKDFNNKCLQNLLTNIPIVYDELKHQDYKNNKKLLDNINNFKVAKKIIWNCNINKTVNNYKDIFIDNNTLGIHLRFTSMFYHNDLYGNVTIEDYIACINEYITKYNIKNIFIASDNLESIKKIENVFKNIKINYFKGFSRQNSETLFFKNNADNLKFEVYNRDNNKNSYTEVILESIMLSKCKYLIYRVSSVSLLAQLISNNIKISECLNNNKNYSNNKIIEFFN